MVFSLYSGVFQVLSFAVAILLVPFLIWIFSKIFKLKNTSFKTVILVGVVYLLGASFISLLLTSFLNLVGALPSILMLVVILGFIIMVLLMIVMKIFYRENKSIVVAFFAWLIYYVVFPFLLWRYSLYL